ncbi:uncharacterized protein LOC122503418 [Leptopilina heterotoma]|uniref:uncharacterized protein LOC122503418 n=1 Tax=Leptopilina heterotoma TaxID=63436 RepID=UPI001CA8FCBF|nr:uncharacterized protein LOC122503418 [Leptopilina heterotoma]
MNEINKVVDILKIQLSTNKSQTRAQIIFYLLEVLRENNSEELVTQLVYNGIISDLLQNVNLLSSRDFLECLLIIVGKNAFYTNGLIDETIQGITKYHLIDSIELSSLAVNLIVSIVTKVFVDFTESQGIQLIQKHEESLLSFLERTIFDSHSVLSAAKLFNFLIEYSTESFKYIHLKIITFLYGNVIKLIEANNISDLEKFQNICCTSFTLANYCNEITVQDVENKFSGSSSATTMLDIPESKKILIETIRRNTVKDFDTVNALIEFLNTVIKLYTIKDETLCIEMLSRGYLKYLLELSVLYYENNLFRNKVCSLMSEIIVILKDYLKLPIDSWQGGSSAFQIFLRTGFETLTVDCQQWENLLKMHTCQADSLMLLIYCHYIGTTEIFIITQKALTVKLTSVIEKYSEVIFLKAIWLLFSATVLASNISTKNDRSCLKAVKSLAMLLQKKNKIEMAYTHNEDILLYAIAETDFPERFRIKTVSLWLDNSKIDRDLNVLIKKCLLEGYTELKIVKLLVAIIHENDVKDLNTVLNAYVSLLHSENVIPDNVIEFVWKTLADNLPHYSSNNAST